MATLFAFLHHLAAFALVAALVVEFVLIKGEFNTGTASRIQRADLVFGIAAGVLLVVGLLRVVFFEKGLAYYLYSGAFIAKLALFVLVGLLSIYPTLEFLAWSKDLKQGRVPTVDAAKLRRIRTIMHLELVGVVAVILFAALMARGIGSFEQ
jgi:putative membrane protein